ncbi:MAG: hypothetical protein IT314_01715 [Anaerolineales bacterium]|nr:hypothetical protein [Anaerolineales bacterium]
MSHDNPTDNDSDKKRQLDLLLSQLRSARPSDIWRGMEQAREGLKENSEDKGVYGILLDVVQEKPELRKQIRDLFLAVMQRGSISAKNALLALPSSVSDFLADADDAYYAGEYGQAVELYRQVLKLDPENSRAKTQLEKAEKNKNSEEASGELPRSAVQYYRRAHSSLATRDVVTAMNLLDAAIEAARGKGMEYPEAEKAASSIQDLLTADEFRRKAKTAIKDRRWEYALALFDQALEFDPENPIIKNERADLQRQIRSVTILRFSGISVLIIIVLLFLTLFRNGFDNFFPQDNIESTSTFNSLVSTSTLIATTNTPSATVVFMTPTPDISSQAINSTLTPTPSEVSALGIGYINLDFVTAWETPEGGIVARLGLYQPVTIIDKQDFGQLTYLKCSWEIDGIVSEGWILARYIELGAPPSP